MDTTEEICRRMAFPGDGQAGTSRMRTDQTATRDPECTTMATRTSNRTGATSGRSVATAGHHSVSSGTHPSNGSGERTHSGDTVELHIETIGGERGQRSTCVEESYVFLHGLGGTHRYWTAAGGADLLPARSDMVDLFGFGRSPRPFVRYTIEKHLAALEATLADKEPFVLVGHSLGAALAVAYAARHPGQVERLVLISLPAYENRRAAVRWLRQRLRGWFFTNMVLSMIACISIRRLLGPVLPFIVRDVPREVARDLVEHNVMSSTTSLWNVLYRHDIRLDINDLPRELPVTLIHGTGDDTAPIDLVRDLVYEHEGWRLLELDGVDHHPWLREPEACAELITTTFDRAV